MFRDIVRWALDWVFAFIISLLLILGLAMLMQSAFGAQIPQAITSSQNDLEKQTAAIAQELDSNRHALDDLQSKIQSLREKRQANQAETRLDQIKSEIDVIQSKVTRMQTMIEINAEKALELRLARERLKHIQEDTDRLYAILLALFTVIMAPVIGIVVWAAKLLLNQVKLSGSQ